MNSRFDFAKAYYWRVRLLETDDPDDDRYVVLYGDEGEIVGPMTMALAQMWIDHFGIPGRHPDVPPPSIRQRRVD